MRNAPYLNEVAKLPADWLELLQGVESTADGSIQPCYFWAPEIAGSEPVPLLVGLHTWSFNFTSVDNYAPFLQEAKKRGWAFLGPDFRGANDHHEACGSDLAVQDIVDAVAYARSKVNVDESRIFIAGGSGGGQMCLLTLARHPEIFAAGAAVCPITDLARWHADSILEHPGRGKGYATAMERVCGGSPAEKPEEYVHRSPLTFLANLNDKDVKVYIAAGIHDGWIGAVPVGHSIRGFNALALPADAIRESDIVSIEANRSVPESLASESKRDPFYLAPPGVHFRRTSGKVRLTLFEGGHDMNYSAGIDFLSRQRRGDAPDWTIPEEADSVVIAQLTK